MIHCLRLFSLEIVLRLTPDTSAKVHVEETSNVFGNFALEQVCSPADINFPLKKGILAWQMAYNCEI